MARGRSYSSAARSACVGTLLARGVKPAAIHKLREEVDAQVARAIDAARADPEPVFADAFADVYAGAGRR